MNQLKLAGIALLASMLAACSGLGTSMPGPTQNTLPAVSHSSNIPGLGLDLNKVHVMRPLSMAPAFVNPNILLRYGGGPVLRKPGVYVVFWGFAGSGNDPSGEQAYLTAFLNGVGGSSWNNINHQYYQIHNGLTQHIQNPVGELLGTWVDLTNPVPSAPSDSQIQAEASKLEQQVGFNKNASYVVATPHGHNSPGFGTQYCAYHQATTSPGGIIAYTNLPYMTDAGVNCGENFINPGQSGLLDGVSIVEGHEYSESITDPQPFSGWNSSFGEIGDLCAWQKPPAGDIVLSTGTFAVQGLFSNKTASCVIKYP